MEYNFITPENIDKACKVYTDSKLSNSEFEKEATAVVDLVSDAIQNSEEAFKVIRAIIDTDKPSKEEVVNACSAFSIGIMIGIGITQSALKVQEEPTAS